MENMPFPIFMLLSATDNLLLFYLGLGLVGATRPPFRRLLAAALANALFSFVVRNQLLVPGVHIIFQIPFAILSLIVICNLSAIYSTLATLLGLIIMALTQTLVELITVNVSGIPFQVLMNTPKLHLVWAIPDFLACLLIIILIDRLGITPFDFRAVLQRQEKTDEDKQS
mgnify:CR=1 FL=1